MYQSVILSFWREDHIQHFSPCERNFFFYLLSVFAEQQQHPFACNTTLAERDLDMPRKTIIQCRKKLKARGLIDFIEGRGKGNNPYYFFSEVTLKVTLNVTEKVTDNATVQVTEKVTLQKENLSPTPPIKENNNKETSSNEDAKKDKLSLKEQKKKDLDLSFALPSFVPIMQAWLDYKRNKKQSYKDEKSIRLCYQNLQKLSKNNPTIAQLIVEQSIANNWAGLFELKQNGGQIQNSHNPGYCSKQEANQYAFEQFAKYREARDSGLLDEVEKPW